MNAKNSLNNKPKKKLIICSGGQTGVDQGVLEAAWQYKKIYQRKSNLSVSITGWCPKFRRTELGEHTINDKYPLKETKSENFSVRTKQNVRDSDATLILSKLNFDQKQDGTYLTKQEAIKLKKPYIVIYLDNDCKENIKQILQWLNKIKKAVNILNVGGPRESNCPGIYKETYIFMTLLIKEIEKKW